MADPGLNNMIVLREVCKSYDGGRTFAVRDVSLNVGAGELLILLGSSGCGKTTTLKMINRLIEPTRGVIEVNGRDVLQQNPVELRRSIGYVFQGIGLFPHMTIAENIGVVPRLLGWSTAQIDERVDALLEMMSLPLNDFRHRWPGQLSGGQRQRIGLARALAAQPGLMLMDEPFGALDPVTRQELQDEYVRIHRDLGLSTIMVTHDMTEALLLADRIAVMRDGRILQLGTPHELISNPQDDFVQQMLEAPRKQTERLEELMEPDDTPSEAGHAR